MKKIAMTLLAVFSFTWAFAQKGEATTGDSLQNSYPLPVFLEFGIGYTPRQNGITSYYPSITAGYEVINRVSVFYSHEWDLMLNRNKDKRYEWSKMMGGGLSYRFVGMSLKQSATHRASNAVDVRAYVTTTYGKVDVKHTDYNLKFVNYVYRGKGALLTANMYIGLGYKYIDSHTEGIKNSHNFYAELGVRF